MSKVNRENDKLVLQHLKLVIQANKTTNLTRIDSIESGKLLHIEDSLSGLEDLNKCPCGLYGDLGSGAGYPGIPLAIYSNRSTVLIESVGKKARALDYFIKELKLNNIETYNSRIEELGLKSPAKFSVLTARALSSLASLNELASPLLKLGGKLLCYKSRVQEDEIKHINEIEDLIGMRYVYKRDFLLSDKKTNRCIVVFEKVSQPKLKLPRRVGLAQKKPL